MKFLLLLTILPLGAILATNQQINVHVTPEEAASFTQVDSAGFPVPVPIRRETEASTIPIKIEGEFPQGKPPSPADLAVFKRILLESVEDTRSLESLLNLFSLLNQHVFGSEVSNKGASSSGATGPQSHGDRNSIVRNLEAIPTDSAPLPQAIQLSHVSGDSIEEEEEEALDEADIIRSRLQSMLVEQELADNIQQALFDEGVSPVSILLAEGICALTRQSVEELNQPTAQLTGATTGGREQNHVEQPADESDVRSSKLPVAPSPAALRQLSIQDIRYRMGDVIGQVLYGNRPVRRLVSPLRGPVETLLSGNRIIGNRRGIF